MNEEQLLTEIHNSQLRQEALLKEISAFLRHPEFDLDVSVEDDLFGRQRVRGEQYRDWSEEIILHKTEGQDHPGNNP